eukprot:9471592-Pyramimonas_sp.AAC.1
MNTALSKKGGASSGGLSAAKNSTGPRKNKKKEISNGSVVLVGPAPIQKRFERQSNVKQKEVSGGSAGFVGAA